MISFLPSALLLFFVVCRLADASSEERLLIKSLTEKHDTVELPVQDHRLAVAVRLRLLLQNIVSLDEKSQQLTLIVWKQMKWNDYSMQWNPSKYGNITNVRLPIDTLWKPDVLLFNSVDRFDTIFPVNFVVQHTGDVLLAPPCIVKATCKMDVTWFPFDTHVCTLKYGSWTYPGSKLELMLDSDGSRDGKNGTANELTHAVDTSYYVPSADWLLVAAPGRRKIADFDGERYVEVLFDLVLRRRTLLFGLNWLLPSLLIAASCTLTFLVPPQSQERVALQIANLFSTTVFLNMLSEVTPPSAESIPLIGLFFSISFVVLGLSLICTVFVLNLHYRPSTRRMGPKTRRLFLDVLPRLLCMHLPHPPKRPAGEFVGIPAYKPATATTTNQHHHQNDDRNSCPHGLLSKWVVCSEEVKLFDRLDDLRRLLHCLLERLSVSDNHHRNSFEWETAASVLDRLWLVLISLATIVTLCVLVIMSVLSSTQHP